MLLQVRGLTVRFGDDVVVDDVSFDLDSGQRLGIIGESGAGKTLTSLAVIGLLPDTASVQGSIVFDGVELLEKTDAEMTSLRGNRIGMVFQEPLTALNPLMRVGKQIAQPLRIHRGMRMKAALDRATELCAHVGLPDPERTARMFPHQLSGGQRQRIGLAIALACGPSLLIADEPTSALDVTVQEEVLKLIDGLVKQEGSSLVFVSHDLPVVAAMRGGKIVELAETRDFLDSPRHEYSQLLIRAANSSDDDFLNLARPGKT